MIIHCGSFLVCEVEKLRYKFKLTNHVVGDQIGGFGGFLTMAGKAFLDATRDGIPKVIDAGSFHKKLREEIRDHKEAKKTDL